MQDFFPSKEDQKMENALYVVATPIGNLKDITLRALETLQNVDIIACEDSRVSNKLLQAYNIHNKTLINYNDLSDEKIRLRILNDLLNGNSIALISDAGTPLISDPGYKLIKFLQENNQKIITIPGASSLTAAISASGLACDNFLFLGFLPTTKIQKENFLKSLPQNFTFIFFESANRVLNSLETISSTLGTRKICAARELTKIHEEFVTDDTKNLIEYFSNNSGKLRGEFVIIVEKSSKESADISEEELISLIKKSLQTGKSLKDISHEFSEIYQINRKKIYQLGLEI